MPTDSEILTAMRNVFGSCGQLTDAELATLRKYAAIARACEAGTHKVVPVEPTEAMNDAILSLGKPRFGLVTTRETWAAMLAAAPQFQEE